MQTLDVGEPITLFSDWWDANNAPVEPTAIDLTVTAPDGTATVYAKAAMTGSAGTTGDPTLDHWTKQIIGSAAGVWRYEFDGTIGGEHVRQGGLVLVGAAEAGGPCEPWCTWDDVTRCGTPPELTSEAQEIVLDQASGILFDLTGRFYPGLCTTTRSLCFACRACAPLVCSCDPYPSVDLSSGFPVWAAYDVIVDGVTLDPSAYRVTGQRYLTRLDGQVWATGWDGLDLDAFRVTWVYGRRPPPAGRLAAARFALEIAKLCGGDKSCQLPQRVTNIQREGVTYTVLDSMAMVADGRTGLSLVDLWIVADQRGRKPKPHAFHPALGPSRRYA